MISRAMFALGNGWRVVIWAAGVDGREVTELRFPSESSVVEAELAGADRAVCYFLVETLRAVRASVPREPLAEVPAPEPKQGLWRRWGSFLLRTPQDA